MGAAEARCAAEKIRFTPVRRKVLEILLQEHRAMGAYDILDRLREDACAHPGAAHAPAFMICRVCDAVAETQAAMPAGALGAAARAAGFRIERTVVEAEGVCPACTAKDRA